MVTIILLIILFLAALLFVPFARQLAKDKMELAANPINEKFGILVGIINDALLAGGGEVTLFDDNPKLMNLFSKDQANILIQFFYGTGNLTITLNYKYYQRELVFKKEFYHLREASIYQQKDVANEFIELCQEKIMEHQRKVSYESVNGMKHPHQGTGYASDPTNVLSFMFTSASNEMRCSLVNFMVAIAQEAGLVAEKDFLEIPPLANFILSLNVKWEDCRQRLLTMGEKQIYEDLDALDESAATMLMLTSAQTASLLNVSNHPEMESKFYSSFERIGYSREVVDQTLTKMMAMSQMFL